MPGWKAGRSLIENPGRADDARVIVALSLRNEPHMESKKHSSIVKGLTAGFNFDAFSELLGG